MPELHIGKAGRKKFTLPLAVATEASAVFGIRGTGKTVTGKRIVEQGLELGAQVVVLDPLDAWWGLKSSADGKKAGYPVLVLGGEQGDLPLSATAGAAVAEFVVQQRASVVLSLSLMSSTEQKRFTADFAERLYLLKARQENRTPVLVAIDEASMLVPQIQRSYGKRDQGARAGAAITALVRRGRSRGIGALIIDQRPASVNKDVTTQASLLICHAVTGKRDLVALREWVELHDRGGRVAEFEEGLASLEVGEAWFWLPRLDLFERVQVAMVETFDSSATPEYGEEPVLPEAVAEFDLDELREQMAGAIAEAEANDPKALKRRIAEFERDLRNVEHEAPDPEALEAERDRGREEGAHKAQDVVRAHLARVKSLERVYSDACNRLAAIGHSIDTLTESLRQAVEGGGDMPSLESPAGSSRVANPAKKSSYPGTPQRRGRSEASPPRTETRSEGEAVSGPQEKILGALADLEAIGIRDPKRTVVAGIVGVSPRSSGFEKNLSTLRAQHGYIDYPQPGHIGFTEEGRAAAPATSGPVTLDDLHAGLKRHLSGPQQDIVDVLISIYPDAMHREDLAVAVNVSANSSGFEKNISTLRTFGAVDYPQPGHVVATDLLFPEGLR